jgi:HAD superfamily hydrolase (TIGR01549 family)
MSNEISRLQTQAVAAQLDCGVEEATAIFQKRYLELKSNTKALNSFGVDGVAFFIDVWDNLDLPKYIQSNPALVEAFERISHYPQFILTNSNTQQQVVKKLACIGLSTDLFQTILTSVELGFNKPDLRAFQALVQATGQEPGAILYVGDRAEVDTLPARQIGLKTALVGKIPDNQSKADLYLEKPEHLASLLEEKR